jgi:outer membrane protein OmpA-like peptidoglycan-associated protein
VKEAGLRGISFSTKGYGADNPVASNTKPDGSDDPEGRQKNRRVEIVMRKKS